MRAFLGEHRPHAAVAILRAATQCCFLQAPRGGLGVQITDVFELAGSKKSVAYKTEGAFYAPFFVAARDRHRARLEPIMGGQLQERRMEANRLGAPLEHRTFEVVIKDTRGTAPQAVNASTWPRRKLCIGKRCVRDVVYVDGAVCKAD